MQNYKNFPYFTPVDQYIVDQYISLIFKCQYKLSAPKCFPVFIH